MAEGLQGFASLRCGRQLNNFDSADKFPLAAVASANAVCATTDADMPFQVRFRELSLNDEQQDVSWVMSRLKALITKA